MIKNPDKVVKDFNTQKPIKRHEVMDYSLNCVGCGRLTPEYDHLYGWYVCFACDSDECASDLADDIARDCNGY